MSSVFVYGFGAVGALLEVGVIGALGAGTISVVIVGLTGLLFLSTVHQQGKLNENGLFSVMFDEESFGKLLVKP